jgi:DNA-binding NarL/FixJ family response regulator
MSPVFGVGSVLAPARQVPRAVLIFADAAADGMTARRALEALGGIRGLDRDPSIGLRAQIQLDAIDAVLCCITSKGTQPVPLLEVIAAAHPQAPVMLLADQGAEERAEEAISGGLSAGLAARARCDDGVFAGPDPGN